MVRMRTYRREEVLELAVELAAEYGESLTLTAFRRETGLSQHVIFDLFGNWCELRVAVGLSREAPRSRNKVSKEMILNRMRELAADYGEELTEHIFLAQTRWSSRLIQSRFGNWGNLREEVGLTRRAKLRKNYSNHEILEDLYRVYRKRKKPPAVNQHRAYGGMVSPQTIKERFGSWRQVKLLFEMYRRWRDGAKTESGWEEIDAMLRPILEQR